MIDLYGGPNWAACSTTRKSKSGGAILLGQHCLKTWSRAQPLVAKSSAEVELYAVVRASCEGLGAHTSSRCRRTSPGQSFSSTPTPPRVLSRESEGLAKVPHIDVNVLWIQEQGVRRNLPCNTIIRTSNPADLMTKHESQDIF